MADALVPPEGPVSATRADPFGAKSTAKAPGPALGLTTIGASVPLVCTWKASMLLVAFSVTSRNSPSGLKDNDPGPELPVERYARESGIGLSVPSRFNQKPTTLLVPPALTT